MPRTIGAVDRFPRKTRKDKGKKHKTYRGKPPKGKKHRYFPKFKGHKTSIKIHVWERVPMSYEGYKSWNPKVRKHIHPEITKQRAVHTVEVSDFDTKKKIEEWLETNYWVGTFVIMGWSKAKTKTRVKRVKLCKLQVRETSEGLKARMIQNTRLSRYWFYRK